MQVQKVGDSFVLPQSAALALQLEDGAEIEIARAASRHHFMTVEETMRAYNDTLPDHIEAYRELAK